MKTLSLTVISMLVSFVSIAQWTGTNPGYFTSGDIGIGTSSPGARLHVSGGDVLFQTQAGGYVTLRLKSSDGSNTLAFDYNSIRHSGGSLYLRSGAGGNLIINDPGEGGNVGIGTASPLTKLHVVGAVYANAVRSDAVFNGYPHTENGNLIGTEGYWTLRTGTNNAFNLDLYNSGTPITAMTALQNGNFGIGTTTPQVKFEVVGFGQILRSTGAGSYTSLRLYNDTNNMMRSLEIDYSGSSYGSALVNGGPVGESASITTVGAFPLTLGTSNTMRMTILGNGNVGIGTPSPDAKLAVNGQVHATEVRVTTTVPGPDYVFDKDYRFLSLEEIRTYIAQHHHLPEVPSAKEMEIDGVKLGEMNMLLLKKVEELTLYMIELKQDNIALSEEVKSIKQNQK